MKKFPRVLHKNLLLKKIEKEADKPKGILIIPDASKKDDRHFQVIAIGEDVENVHVGNEVIVANYCGADVVIDEVPYLITGTDNVLAILK